MKLFILKISRQVLLINQFVKQNYSQSSINLMQLFQLQTQLFHLINKNQLQIVHLNLKRN